MEKKNFTFIGSNLFCNNAFFISNKYLKFFQKLKIDNLEEYTNFKFREEIFDNNKNIKKKMLFKIKDFELYDFEKKEKRKIKDLFDLNEK